MPQKGLFCQWWWWWWWWGQKSCLSIYLSIYDPFLDLGRFLSFLILFTDGRTPWMGDQPAARPLPTHMTTQAQNKRKHTSMAGVGFEPTIPVFRRAKTVHALDARPLWSAEMWPIVLYSLLTFVNRCWVVPSQDLHVANASVWAV
jgi:hypothetical protein